MPGKSRAFEAHAAETKQGELGERGDVGRDYAAELVAAKLELVQRSDLTSRERSEMGNVHFRSRSVRYDNAGDSGPLIDRLH